MSLALFDLDNTLLDGDSDYLWGQFLVENHIVERGYYERENQRFYDEYLAGSLDILEFLRFQLRPLAENDAERLFHWRDRFMEEKISPAMLEEARKLIAWHRSKGDIPVIITATNRFITGPIAVRFEIDHLLATEPEMKEGRYTGMVSGTPCFQDGKIVHLEAWLEEHGHSLEDSWFYSDSHNDLPLLRLVTHPVAVDPDEILDRHAGIEGWPVISLRQPSTSRHP